MPKPLAGSGAGALPHKSPPKPAPPPSTSRRPAPPIAQYSFALESMHISKTRSPRHDTNALTFSLKIGSQAYQPFVRLLGDLGDGEYPLGLRFAPVNVAPNDPVAFTYVVVNSGYDASNEGTIEDVTNLLSEIGQDVLNDYLPGLGTLGNYLVKKLHGILYADCDGIVVADKIHEALPSSSFLPPGVQEPAPGQPIPPLTGLELWDWTANGTHRETRKYPGSDSPVGCGENSLYFMTWSISRLSG